jgi:DNA-directed RNA polymerase specialized sigma24 family protein
VSAKDSHAKRVSELVAAICDELNKQTDLGVVVTEGAETIEALRSGIGAIAARRRQAVRGLHESGLSYQQIADRVGLHKQSVVLIAKS